MAKLSEIKGVEAVLDAVVGSARYGYAGEGSDRDYFRLTRDTDIAYHDPGAGETWFLWSVQCAKDLWGHPMLMGDLTADCTGPEALCAFLRARRREIAYAAPSTTAQLGLAYIGAKESIGADTAAKPALLTAYILSHMASGAQDPFLLSGEEKDVLIRARTGDVQPEERVGIYRRTISPENIDRLMRMPDHPTIKNELFQLIEEVITC